MPTLTVSALAKRLGVAPATLRTWDRRYGIGPSAHRHGRHRRYSTDDVARLECMLRALDGGASSADAARYALNTTATSLSEIEHLPSGFGVRDDFVTSVKTRVSPPVRTDSPARPNGADIARIDAAIVARDLVSVHRTLERIALERGVVALWDELVTPLVTRARGLDPESAALFVECLTGVFTTLTVDAPIGTGVPVLASPMPGSPPPLEFRALAAALARLPVNLRVAAPVSRSAFGSSVVGSGAAVVMLWAVDEPAEDVLALTRWLRRRCRGVAVAVGPGEYADLPRAVARFGSLTGGVRCAADLTV